MKKISFLLIFVAFSTLLAVAQKAKPIKGKDMVITISTRNGDMVALLYDATPKHKANFIKLANEHFFDSTTFHRVINGFMIQGGDPNTKPKSTGGAAGNGGPGYQIDAEFVAEIGHKRGSIAAARDMNPQMRSNGSQFYIVHKPESCRHLNGSYTVFGEVIKGLEVIDAIAAEPTSRGDMPVKPVYMKVSAQEMKKKKIQKIYGYKYAG